MVSYETMLVLTEWLGVWEVIRVDWVVRQEGEF